MAGNKSEKRIVLPGISIVYLNEDDAFAKFAEEHRSRTKLQNVCFRIYMDTEEGRPNYKSLQQNRQVHGTLQTCFNLEKLMESQEYKDQAMVSRLFATIQKYYQERDYATDQKVHYFCLKQKHPKYELIMDWEYKEETGKEP